MVIAGAISGSQQVGWGEDVSTGEKWHALLWNGSATGYIDLNPSGYHRSKALDTSGSQQVGFGHATRDSYAHALLWNGTASSFVDLAPSGFYDSQALSTDGTH